MPNLTSQTLPTVNGMLFDYTNIGTAAGTTTIYQEPCILGAVIVTRRKESGVAVIYDSVGTSGTVIGTIAMGTQTFSDPPAPFVFNVRTKNGLTISNTADFGLTVAAI